MRNAGSSGGFMGSTFGFGLGVLGLKFQVYAALCAFTPLFVRFGL